MRANGQTPQKQSLPSPSPLISLWASENVYGVGRKSSATVIAGSSVIRRNASASVGPRGRRRKHSVVIGKRDVRQSHDALLAREKRFRKPCRVKAKRFPSCRRRVIRYRAVQPRCRPMSAIPVRRDKAALSSGCKSHPANAPAGSNRSSHGGNEVAEAFG